MISHKPYRMPADPVYMPLHVGAALHPDAMPDWVQDNTGGNISERNAKYSELTGLYWLWKNDVSQYQGIVHYRRHFGSVDGSLRLTRGDRFERIASGDEMLRLLQDVDIILPRRRNYHIETIYSYYAHTFPKAQLDTNRTIIAELQQTYLSAFDTLVAGTCAHMLIMSRKKLDEYYSWLFLILEELEERIDDSGFDAFNARYPGRIGEMLMDVWLNTDRYQYAELPVISPERVNWVKKGSGFLMEKFFGKSIGEVSRIS